MEMVKALPLLGLSSRPNVLVPIKVHILFTRCGFGVCDMPRGISQNICDLFVSRDDPLMSWKTSTRTERLCVLSHDGGWGRGWAPVEPV